MAFDLRTLTGVVLLAGLAWSTAASAGGKVRFDKEGHAYNPVFSQDGKWVAFEVNDLGGDIQLFEAQLQGELAMKDAQNVALPGGSNPFGGTGQVVANPTWHPTGVVVFEGSNQGGNLRLYYHQPGGGAAAEMISQKEIPGDLTFPTISPDGSNMAFIADATGNGDVRIRNTNTSVINQVTTSSHSEMFPLFTADAKRLVFTRKQDNTEDVFLLDISTGSESEVVPTNGRAGDQTRPVFGGGGILYFDSSRGEGMWDLVFVDGPMGNRKVIAKDVDLPLRARPAVSPNGEWVAYAYSDPQKADQIQVAKIDGSKTVTVSSEFNKCSEPAIGVQDGRVLLAYTALPQSGSDWRFLYVEDITDKL